MKDQADALRRRALARERAEALPAAEPPAFVVGSGKGGAGKSVLSLLLASALARDRHRVLLVDGAQNQANLHVLLGLPPARHLSGVLRGETRPESLVVAAAERLWLLPAASGAESVYGLAAVDRARLHQRLTELYDGFDAVVIDAGPGLESAVRATMRASRLLVVAVPEPAALSDAYALIKIVTLQAPSLPVDVIVNRVVDPAEGPAVFARLSLAARRFLRRDLDYLGAVAEDAALHEGVRRPAALLEAKVGVVGAIARRLMGEARAVVAPAPGGAA